MRTIFNKPLILLILMLIILFSMLNYSQSIKQPVINQYDISPITKVSRLNYDVVLDNSTSTGYSATIALPVTDTNLIPIPTPTPTIQLKPENTVENPYKITVDISKQLVSIMTRDENGVFSVVYRQFSCSTGKNNTPTVLGDFKVQRKNPWLMSYPTELSNGDEYRVYARYRTTITGDYHFHSILYSKYDDHNSLIKTSFRNIGRKASHGCIRLLVRDAKWIYNHCDIGTPISIVSRGGPALDQSVYQPIPLDQKLPSGVNYDPTDLTHVNKLK